MISATIALAIALGGCGTPTRSGTWLAPLFRSASTVPAARTPATATSRKAGARPARHATAAITVPSAALVERSLRRRGLRFGTDGSVFALYSYMRDRHDVVAAREARPGDVVFFRASAPESPDCGDHTGLVESVDADGRITFREARNGGERRSYVQPAEPRRRRDSAGRVLNTFLRVKHPDDPAGARYFSGEMLCAVIRPEA